jgi:hypothetical protein
VGYDDHNNHQNHYMMSHKSRVRNIQKALVADINDVPEAGTRDGVENRLMVLELRIDSLETTVKVLDAKLDSVLDVVSGVADDTASTRERLEQLGMLVLMAHSE